MEFNLVTEKWISIINHDNQTEIMSLSDVFSSLNDIRHIAGNPLDKFSISFLLFCITQAALDGPDDEDDWKECKGRIGNSVIKYLKKWKKCFNIFDEKHPFLQTLTLKVEGGSNREHAFLDYTNAFGNRHVLFDSEGRKNAYFKKCNKQTKNEIEKNGEIVLPSRKIENKDLALQILIKQIFAVGGKIDIPSADSTWHGKETKKSCQESIPINKVLTIIEGENLLDTIHNNLIPKAWLKETKTMSLGRPIWEYDVIQEEDKAVYDIEKNKTMDKNEIINTYLYNLIPFSRSIRLEKDGKMSIAEGIRSSNLITGFRHPMGTIVKIEEDSFYLRIDVNKAPWRNLQSILQIPKIFDAKSSGPWALRHFMDTDTGMISILTGGFAVEKAKIITASEWNFKIETSMIHDGPFRAYETFFQDAENCAEAVRIAIKEYLKLDNFKAGIYKTLSGNAMSQFWYVLGRYETEVRKDITRTLSENDGEYLLAMSKWRKDLHSYSLDAFNGICSHHRSRLCSYVKTKNVLEKILYGRLKNGKFTEGQGEGQVGALAPQDAGVPTQACGDGGYEKVTIQHA